MCLHRTRSNTYTASFTLRGLAEWLGDGLQNLFKAVRIRPRTSKQLTIKKINLILVFLLCSTALWAQENPLTIENYYKLKWGHTDKFIALW